MCVGNSPVQIHKAQLEELYPLWHELALKFNKDAAASKAFGWIQEVRACALLKRQGQVHIRVQESSAST